MWGRQYHNQDRVYDKHGIGGAINASGNNGLVVRRWSKGTRQSGGVMTSNQYWERGVLRGVSRTIMAHRADASVVCKVARGGLYTNASPNFQRGILKGMARTIKCDDDNGYVAKIEREDNTQGTRRILHQYVPGLSKSDIEGS